MKCEMCFPLECHRSAKVRTAVMKRLGARFGLALAQIFPIMLYLLRFMMHTMDLEMPLLHIRAPIGNRWQESTIYSWINCEMQSKRYLRERSSNRCCPGLTFV